MKVRCQACGETTQARVPKGGDGSVVQPYAHGGPPGDRCRGSWRDVPLEDTIPEEGDDA